MSLTVLKSCRNWNSGWRFFLTFRFKTSCLTSSTETSLHHIFSTESTKLVSNIYYTRMIIKIWYNKIKISCYQLYSGKSKGLLIWQKLSRLGGKIIPTRSRHNANFHQQKSSIHMSWKFLRLPEISRTADRDLGQAGKYFLIRTHFPGWVRYFFPMKQVQKSIT